MRYKTIKPVDKPGKVDNDTNPTVFTEDIPPPVYAKDISTISDINTRLPTIRGEEMFIMKLISHQKAHFSGIVGLMQTNGKVLEQCDITQMEAVLRSISKLPELVMKAFTNKSFGVILSEEVKRRTDYIEWGTEHNYKTVPWIKVTYKKRRNKTGKFQSIADLHQTDPELFPVILSMDEKIQGELLVVFLTHDSQLAKQTVQSINETITDVFCDAEAKDIIDGQPDPSNSEGNTNTTCDGKAKAGSNNIDLTKIVDQQSTDKRQQYRQNYEENNENPNDFPSPTRPFNDMRTLRNMQQEKYISIIIAWRYKRVELIKKSYATVTDLGGESKTLLTLFTSVI